MRSVRCLSPLVMLCIVITLVSSLPCAADWSLYDSGDSGWEDPEYWSPNGYVRCSWWASATGGASFSDGSASTSANCSGSAFAESYLYDWVGGGDIGAYATCGWWSYAEWRWQDAPGEGYANVFLSVQASGNVYVSGGVVNGPDSSVIASSQAAAGSSGSGGGGYADASAWAYGWVQDEHQNGTLSSGKNGEGGITPGDTGTDNGNYWGSFYFTVYVNAEYPTTATSISSYSVVGGMASASASITGGSDAVAAAGSDFSCSASSNVTLN